MGNDSNSVTGILHLADRHFPKFFYLYDHTELVSCISVDNDTEYTEVQELILKARIDCKHWNMIGECLDIKPATWRDWERMH